VGTGDAEEGRGGGGYVKVVDGYVGGGCAGGGGYVQVVDGYVGGGCAGGGGWDGELQIDKGESEGRKCIVLGLCNASLLLSFCSCFCCCLFLSMVVWQPFFTCWRLIITRVSEMHVAYHKVKPFVGYLFIGTSQNNKTRPLHLLSLSLLT
jgi:hypothetical protein